jgi:hypothetical protein
LWVFEGFADGDEAGNSVAGIGNGFFMVGAPKFGAAPKAERGAVYVFASLRGVSGSGSLLPFSIVLGPSFQAHLGGIPAGEFSSTGYRGYSVSGIRNPALIPVADELPNDSRYDVIGGPEPDVLLGAPDACVDADCAETDIDPDRNGLVYLLSGTELLTVGGTFDLSLDADLKRLGGCSPEDILAGTCTVGSAVVVQGAADADRLGTTVSGAGDLDGDNVSDFMFSAPDRDIPGPTPGLNINNAGDVYVVFGREVNDTPFPDGNCRVDLTLPPTSQNNFRQCRDADGLVVPLDAGSFVAAGNFVGLTWRGEATGERAGVALGEAGNFLDPVGRIAAVQPGQVGVSEILIGAPFHDTTVAGGFRIPAVGRAYVVFGSRDYRTVSGQARALGFLDDTSLGLVIDGRTANDNYGIAVAAAGNVHDPAASPGGDIIIGGNRIEVTLQGATAPDVGEVELFFGMIGGAAGIVFPISFLPFVQPGAFGPQVFVGGFWSFSNTQPPAGIVSQFPMSSGVGGPFVPAFPFGAVLFLPGRALKGAALLARTHFALDANGHLLEIRQTKRGVVTRDISALIGAPELTSIISANIVADARGRATFEIFAQASDGRTVRFFLERRRWSFSFLA